MLLQHADLMQSKPQSYDLESCIREDTSNVDKPNQERTLKRSFQNFFGHASTAHNDSNGIADVQQFPEAQVDSPNCSRATASCCGLDSDTEAYHKQSEMPSPSKVRILSPSCDKEQRDSHFETDKELERSSPRQDQVKRTLHDEENIGHVQIGWLRIV